MTETNVLRSNVGGRGNQFYGGFRAPGALSGSVPHIQWPHSVSFDGQSRQKKIAFPRPRRHKDYHQTFLTLSPHINQISRDMRLDPWGQKLSETTFSFLSFKTFGFDSACDVRACLREAFSDSKTVCSKVCTAENEGIVLLPTAVEACMRSRFGPAPLK